MQSGFHTIPQLPNSMKTLKIFILLSLSVLFSGCMIMDTLASKAGYEKRDKIELKIDELKKDKEKALIEQEKNIRSADLALLTQTKSNFQQTTNWLYGAFLGSEMITDKNRLDEVINFRLKTALGYSPGPTPEAILDQNKLLKEEINETKITKAELEKRYAAKEKEAETARLAETERAKEVKAAEIKKIELEKAYNDKLNSEQDKLNRANGDLLALKEKQIETSEADSNLKKIMMGWFFAGAALAAIGAYFLRSLELAIGAICLAAAAIAIPFLKTWMVLSAIATIIIVIGFIIYKKYYNEKGIANRAVGAIQEIRNESEQVYQNDIKPKLQDWFKDAGNLTKQVEKKIIELHQK